MNLIRVYTIYCISGRLSDTWVTVSDEEDVTPNDDNICNEIINGEQDVVTVTCDYKDRTSPPHGRYVTIRRKDNANDRHILNFCEVEVLSCFHGFWGKDSANHGDCSRSCARCVEGNCRVSDGHCYSRCQEGYWGDVCNDRCHCQACDRLTGCEPGVPQFNFVTARKRSLGQGNVFTPVCDYVHGGIPQQAMGRGVCISTSNGGNI